jgi:PII-like signaling protein
MMSEEGLRLSVYFGERERVGGRLLADRLMGLYARQRLRTSVLLRGVEGFGIKHRLQTERLLTLSEDLPMVALALDTPARIANVLEEVRAISAHGLVALERARLLGAGGIDRELPGGADEVKLTICVGRQQHVEGRPAYLAVVDALHRHAVAGASVLLGLDGTAAGVRRRAGFLARNAQVPLLIQSVGEHATIERALIELTPLLGESAMTLERVRVCKRDGVLLRQPLAPPTRDGAGLAYWQKLVVYASEQTRFESQPLHAALIRRLRQEGAAGATALRGQWGYHGAHQPHGERFWSLGRHVPVLTVLLDTPANMLRWFAIVDQMTAEAGLVTSETVPALRAGAPGVEHGGLELAARHAGQAR